MVLKKKTETVGATETSPSSSSSRHQSKDDLPMHLARLSFLKEIGGTEWGKPEENERPYVPALLKKRMAKHIAKRAKPPKAYNQKGHTVILMGETGCGKSTQVPQIVLRWLKKKFPKLTRPCIAITEPRRLAAVTLATRVREEMKLPADSSVVAHSVRFDTNYAPENTNVHFLTEGILLQQIISDPYLTAYQVVIVDEAHERSIATDLIMGYLKKLVYYRSKVADLLKSEMYRLKLIIMTATGEASSLRKFFPGSKLMFIEGRTHPVKISYLSAGKPSCDQDYLTLITATVFKLHNDLPLDEHFLVFLTGQEEIDGLVHQLRTSKQYFPAIVCPLYAALTKQAQERAFQIPPFGTRKIVVATNIAETSLTIPGIKVVIDSGFIKTKLYLASHGLEAYKIHPISKSQATQRAGRAGRECEGHVYRLYSNVTHDGLRDFEPPEIQRSNLAQLHLMLPHFYKLDGTFQFMTEAKKEVVADAKLELETLGFIDIDSEELTDLGRSFSKFPLEPRLSAVLHSAVGMGIVEQVAAIISVMEIENLFLPKKDDGRNMELENQKFWAPEGDLITYLNIFQQFVRSKKSKQWCEKNRLRFRSMNYAFRVRKQLLELTQRYIKESDIPYTQRTESLNNVIINCFAQKIGWQRATLDPTGKYYRVEAAYRRRNDSSNAAQNVRPKKVLHAKIHPISTLVRSRPPEIIFMKATLNEKSDLFLHHCSIYEKSIADNQTS